MCHREEVRRGDLCWQLVYNEGDCGADARNDKPRKSFLCISMHKGAGIIVES